jgi:hypothetical protein
LKVILCVGKAQGGKIYGKKCFTKKTLSMGLILMKHTPKIFLPWFFLKKISLYVAHTYQMSTMYHKKMVKNVNKHLKKDNSHL